MYANFQQHHPFRLLDLPPELWTRIVKMAATSPNGLEHYIAKYPDKKAKFFPPPITQVCRAIRTEALGAYYENNVFRFGPEKCFDSTLEVVRDWIDERADDGYWWSMKPVMVDMCCADFWSQGEGKEWLEEVFGEIVAIRWVTVWRAYEVREGGYERRSMELSPVKGMKDKWKDVKTERRPLWRLEEQ